MKIKYKEKNKTTCAPSAILYSAHISGRFHNETKAPIKITVENKAKS